MLIDISINQSNHKSLIPDKQTLHFDFNLIVKFLSRKVVHLVPKGRNYLLEFEQSIFIFVDMYW